MRKFSFMKQINKITVAIIDLLFHINWNIIYHIFRHVTHTFDIRNLIETYRYDLYAGYKNER